MKPMGPREQLVGGGRALAERGRLAWGGAQSRFVGARLAADLYRRYRRTNATLAAGNLAYRLFFFLVPCMLLIISVAGYTTATGGSVEAGVGQMGLGKALGEAMSQAGEDAQSGWQLAMTVGVAGVVIGAYSLYRALFLSYAQMWELSATDLRRRFSSAVRFIVGLIAFIVFLWLMSWIRHHGPILGTAGVLASVGADLALFAVMSSALPHRGAQWVHLLPGAIAGGIAALGLQVATAVWLPNLIAARSETYGALGIAVAVLAYLALFGTTLVLVPLVNATWFDYVTEPGSPFTHGWLSRRFPVDHWHPLASGATGPAESDPGGSR